MTGPAHSAAAAAAPVTARNEENDRAPRWVDTHPIGIAQLRLTVGQGQDVA